MHERFEKMRTELNLTDQQTAAVRAILMKRQRVFRALRTELRPRFEEPSMKAGRTGNVGELWSGWEQLPLVQCSSQFPSRRHGFEGSKVSTSCSSRIQMSDFHSRFYFQPTAESEIHFSG